MKVGIITFYNVVNYGSMLQAYATWQFLKARGHEVEFINQPFGRFENSVPHRFLWCFKIRKLHVIRNRFRDWVRFPMTYFSRNYPQSRYYNSVVELVNAQPNYDAVVVGADLVWRPDWCAPKYTQVAFLAFAPPGCKRIAYAASFCVREWGLISRDEVGALLKKFDAIGIREESGNTIIRALCGREDQQVVIDPALILDVKEYAKLASRPCPGRYIFKYLLEWSDGDNERMCVSICCDKLGITEVREDRVLPAGLKGLLCRILHVTSKIGVEDWLRRIMDAQMVVTNSFHGTCFSILFHKPFITLLIPGAMNGLNERVVSLLTKLGLEKRMMFANETEKIMQAINAKIDWQEVDRRLNIQRASTDSFYRKAGL